MQQRLKVIRGDITTLVVDAIVNAANTSLLGGGGVDAAIHRAAGPQLLEECRRVGGCPTGEARITGAYRLPACYVIHTVGPVWKGGTNGEDEQLAQCYQNTLRCAAEHRIKTIAFPSISTGAYRFPIERACRIAVREITNFLKAHQLPQEVTIVCFEDHIYRAYCAETQKHQNGFPSLL